MLILGCGYAGRAVVRALVAAGDRVTGTCAHAAHAPDIVDTGAEAAVVRLGDGEVGQSADVLDRLLADHDALVIGIGPARRDGEQFTDPTGHIVARMRAVGAVIPTVYLSSTGVYGNQDGGWVDEHTPVGADPGPRGRLRQQIEATLLAAHAEWGLPVRLLRLAGIYGPGRHVGLRLQGGNYRVIEADPPLVVNRIHVEDLATVARAALDRGTDGAAYVVADDRPATLREVADYGAGLLGLPAPPGEPADVARQRMGEANFHLVADRKRCRNDRIKTELGVTLAYPDYRSGLRQAFAADGMLATNRFPDPPGAG